MTGTASPSTSSSTWKCANSHGRLSPVRNDAHAVTTSRPTDDTIPRLVITTLIGPNTPMAASHLLPTDQANGFFHTRQGDDRGLNERERRRVLVVVQHQIQSTTHVLSLGLHVEAEVHELRLAFGLVRGDAEKRTGLVPRAHLEVRILHADRVAVTLHFRRPLRRVRRLGDVRIRDRDRRRWWRRRLAHVRERDGDAITPLVDDRELIHADGNGHSSAPAFKPWRRRADVRSVKPHAVPR